MPKYRKSVLVGEVAIGVRDLRRQITAEHVQAQSADEPIMQWLKGVSSRVLSQRFPYLQKKFWGWHLWACGYQVVNSGTITDEMTREYIDEHEGEQVADDS